MSCLRYCDNLDPRVWHHCAENFSQKLQQLRCINHTMTDISPLLMLPHNASVLEIANAYERTSRFTSDHI
jgi:Leucine-rich repeat (LRR) protein